MRRIDFNLNKEQYQKMVNMDRTTLYNYCHDEKTSPFGIPILWGYGLYGIGTPMEKNGNYVIEIEIGNTCD